MTTNIKEAEWLQIFLRHVRETSLEVHVREDEGYKFQAVEQFQKHFDINATDIAGNLDEAIANNNLVAGAMYFPKKMLIIYAQLFPEDTRQVLADLFNESMDVGERITTAQKAFSRLEERRSKQLKQPPANTFIGLRFLSLLLGYKYPDKHNPLKPAEWKVYARFVNPKFTMSHHTSPGDQYKIYCEYIEPLRKYLQTRNEITEIKDKLTEGLIFKDNEYRWVTQDVIFVTAHVYASQRASDFAVSATAKREIESEAEQPEAVDDFGTGFMPLEQHLEEYVVKNWDNIDFGEQLTMYFDDDGTTGQQYTTDVGVIDILAQDKNKNYVVIELKRAESGYKVVGQILNYMGWVQDKLANGDQKVRGIIIVGRADKALKSAVRPVEDKISLKEYSIKMQLEEIKK
jgi:hypothetical protein